MNYDWSTYIQGINTLHSSRSLRFDDMFAEKYKRAFGLSHPARILEIGSGTGALSQSLHRWYPDAEITGIDRDSAFVEFAKKQANGIANVTYIEGDATALPFDRGAFDVTISNTVAEHIEPSAFFGEQYRVLKNGGVCIVLSGRRGIHHDAPCVAETSEFEDEIWMRADASFDVTDKRIGACAYPMSEREYPLCMEKYGLHSVTTEYLTINLTPDDDMYPRDMALAMIDSERQMHLDSIRKLSTVAAGVVSQDEIDELARLTNIKYDKRVELYDAGIKQWDTNVSLTMVLRGVK